MTCNFEKTLGCTLYIKGVYIFIRKYINYGDKDYVGEKETNNFNADAKM